MSTQTTQTPTFSVRDLFNQFAGQDFNDHRQLGEAILPVIMKHRSSFPEQFGPASAMEEAKQNGWLVADPTCGLSVTMHTQKAVKFILRSTNHVDHLQSLIKELQKKCAHRFKLKDEVKLIESRVEDIWIEPKAVPRFHMGSKFSVDSIVWQCYSCSKQISSAYFLYCPLCTSNLPYTADPVTLISEVSLTPGVTFTRKDFRKYLEPGVIPCEGQDELVIFQCNVCNSGFIRQPS